MERLTGVPNYMPPQNDLLSWIKGPAFAIAFCSLLVAAGYNLSRIEAVASAQAHTDTQIDELAVSLARIDANVIGMAARLDRIAEAIRNDRERALDNAAQGK